MAWSTASWWSSSYTYRYCLDITAPGGEAVPAGYSCLLDINTATLVTAGKMLASRDDMRIVYWNGTTNTELDRHYVSASETWFKIQAEITAAATSNAYFCYDKDTEILAQDGWHSLKEYVEQGLRTPLATLNPANNTVEYHPPSEHHKVYAETILKHESKGANFVVTPNHKMWARRTWTARTLSRDDRTGFEFIQADQLPKHYEVKRDFPWTGKEAEWWTLPAYDNGRHYAVPEREIKMDDWLGFLGIYLAEGNLAFNNKTRCGIRITQCHKHNLPQIQKWIEGVGLHTKYYESGHCFVSDNSQMAHYLDQFGHAFDKFIPDEFKQLSPRQLRILLHALVFGDGWIEKGKLEYYATRSERLANDVQEIALKAGYTATLRRDTNAMYIVDIGDSQKTPELQHRFMHEEAYNDYAYCVTVPNHLVFVRRNGRVMWCGNCYCGNSAATAPTVDFDNVYLWGDNFEDGTMTDWDSSLGSGAVLLASTTGAIEGTYSARLTPGSNTGWSIWWDDFTATPTNAVVAVEVRLKHDYSSSRGRYDLWVQHGATQLANVFLLTDGNMYYSPGTSLQAWVDNTACRVRIELDPTAALADAVDVYVDGVSKAANATAYSSFTHVDRVRFGCVKGGAADTSYFWCDSVIVRRLMATAPTVAYAEEAQLVTQTKTIVFDVGTTTEITQTKTVVYDVWAATITKTSTIVFDLLNQITQTKTIKYDVASWDWQGPIHGVYMTPSIHAVKMTGSTHAVIMTPSTHTVVMTRRT